MTPLALLLLDSVPGWVLPGAVIDIDFAGYRVFSSSGSKDLASLLTVTRAQTTNSTNLVPTSASGAAFDQFAANTLRISSTGGGLLVEESRVNNLLNSQAPATQTTASLGTGNWTIWVNGPGSATTLGGTGVGTGFGTATNGSPNTFNLSVAGTVLVTVIGSLNAFQLESGTFGTSLIITAGAPVTRAGDMVLASGALLNAFKAPAQSIRSVSGPSPNLSAFGRTVGFSSPVAPITVNGTQASSFDGTTNLLATLGSGTVGTVAVKVATCFDGTGRSIVANNGTLVTDANTIAQPTSASIGSDGGVGSFLDGPISRLSIWSSRLSNTQLQALST